MFSSLREAVEAIACLGRKGDHFPILSVRWDSVPADMRAIHRWCGWKLIDDRKVPQSPKTGGNARGKGFVGSYSKYDLARFRAEQKSWEGVGFVFDGSDGLVGIDLDDCVAEDGEISPWAAYIISAIGAYTEISPSGTGVKIWAYAPLIELPNQKDGCNWGGVEVYRAGRWFAVTGHVLYPWSSANVSETVQSLIDAAEEFLQPKTEDQPPQHFGPAVHADCESRYGKSALEAETRRVTGAAEGTRNTTLNVAAFKIGQLVGGGVIPEDEAARALAEAGQLAGLPAEEVAATVSSGITAGKQCPRFVPVDQAEWSVDLSQWGSVFEPEGDDEGTDWKLADPGEFPTELLYVPGFIDEVMNYNLRTAYRRQPVLALAGAIALQAVLCGRKVRDERNNRTALYVVSISDSGSGKEHARKVNSDCLDGTTLEGQGDLASDTGLVNTLADRPCLLLQIDEFGKFLRALTTTGKASQPHLTNIIKVFLQMWSSASGVYRGKAYADIEKNKEIDQPNPVVYGTGVPSDFFESLTQESLRDGLLARLMIFEGDSRPKREKPPIEDVPESIRAAVQWWANWKPSNLADIHPQPRTVPATAEAVAVFDGLADEIEAQIGEESDWERSVWNRCEEKACKLALIYACSKNRETPVIDAEAATWAAGVAWYLTRRLIRLGTSHVSDNPFDALQKRVMQRVAKNGGGITQEHFAAAFSYWDRETRAKILSNLLEVRKLVRREYGDGKRKGLEYVVPIKMNTEPGCFRRARGGNKNHEDGPQTD